MFHVLWFEHLLSLFIPHHSSILLFHLILFLFIFILSYTYSYQVSSILIHIVGYHSSIRHRTLLLISIHFHINTPYPLPSFMLFHFYPSIHILLSFSPSSLTTLLHSHSSSHHSSHSFLSTSSSLSHSILIPSFILFHLTQLSFPLLPLSSTSHSLIRFSPYILLFVPILLSITILLLLLLLLTPLSTIILFHIHSHTLHSVHSLLSYLSFFLLEPSSLPFLFIPIFSFFQSLLLPFHQPLPSLSY